MNVLLRLQNFECLVMQGLIVMFHNKGAEGTHAVTSYNDHK